MLSKQASVGVGLGLAALVSYIFDQATPPLVDIRVNPPDADLAAAEKAARWSSAGLVVGVSLITRDGTVFIMGALTVVVLSWLHRHANMVDPSASMASIPSSRTQVHMGDGTAVGYSPAG